MISSHDSSKAIRLKPKGCGQSFLHLPKHRNSPPQLKKASLLQGIWTNSNVRSCAVSSTFGEMRRLVGSMQEYEY